VDDGSSASEVSDNETDDESEPLTTNVCSDCTTNSPYFYIVVSSISRAWNGLVW